MRAGFRRVLGRDLREPERVILERLLSEQRERFRADPAAAAKLVGIGEKPARGRVAAPELAAATMLVSTLMNHDEFVMKR